MSNSWLCGLGRFLTCLLAPRRLSFHSVYLFLHLINDFLQTRDDVAKV